MKKQAGFTLIELIMVIVVLGILTAIALPRIADLSGEAEKATAQGALAAVKSASVITHAQYLAAGATEGSTTDENNQSVTYSAVNLEGEDIKITNEYPAVDTFGTDGAVTVSGICVAAGIVDDFDCVIDSTDTKKVNITTTQGNCTFSYTEAAANSAPTISSVVDDVDDDNTCG